mgnify:CR=1 FL=1
MTVCAGLAVTTASVMRAAGGMRMSLVAGWVLSGPVVEEALGAKGKAWFQLWRFALRFLAPLGVVSIFVANVLM